MVIFLSKPKWNRFYFLSMEILASTTSVVGHWCEENFVIIWRKKKKKIKKGLCNYFASQKQQFQLLKIISKVAVF